jgi:IS5 family transposase
MIITRRKVGKLREYGRKVLLDEVGGGIISCYEVLSEAGREHPHLPENIEGHHERFGRAPELLTADRGLYSTSFRLLRCWLEPRIVRSDSGRT